MTEPNERSLACRTTWSFTGLQKHRPFFILFITNERTFTKAEWDKYSRDILEHIKDIAELKNFTNILGIQQQIEEECGYFLVGRNM